MFPTLDYEYVTYEELYNAYLCCRKRKRSTHNSLEFEINEDVELYKLWKELNKKTYVIGKSIVFCVDKPVKREVFAANFRDRIVHHLIINRINNILEDEFISDSYSCRVGKGTNYGIKKCYDYIKEATDDYKKDVYVVKCDLKSFFMTIDKNRLYDKLIKFLHEKYSCGERDMEFMEWIIGLIIFNSPQNNCIMKQSWSHWKGLPKEKSLFSCKEGYGLPIGNLTSQIFANFYLSEFDHFVKDELGIKYYGRYVDDFFILLDNKEDIKPTIDKCKDKLNSLGVMLHPKKLYIQKSSKGVKFIGGVIKQNRIYISNRTKGNFYWKAKIFEKKLSYIQNVEKREPTSNELRNFISSMNSYLGFMIHYATFKMRRKIFQSDAIQRWNKYIYTNREISKLIGIKKYLNYNADV